MEAKAKALASLSFISFVLLIPAFIWHGKCKNIPAICLMFWLMFNNLTSFIGALIWSTDDIENIWDGKIYCDISIKLEAGSSSGKICAIATLAFNLFMVLRAKDPWFTNKTRRKTYLNLAMCLLTPVFVMATNYIIQSCRFLILRYRGCSVSYASSPVSIVFYSMWNIIWSFIAVVFSSLTLYEYLKKRRDVSDLLKCTNSGLNLKRFARLVIFNLLVVLALVPVTIYYFVNDSGFFKGKFVWSQVHGPFWNEIVFFDYGYSVIFDRWVDIGLSIIAFVLFGLGTDAISMYKTALCYFGFSFSSGTSGTTLSYITELSKNNTPLSDHSVTLSKYSATLNSGRSDWKKGEVIEILTESKSNISAGKTDVDTLSMQNPKSEKSPVDTLSYFAPSENPLDEEMRYILGSDEDEYGSDEICYTYSVKANNNE